MRLALRARNYEKRLQLSVGVRRPPASIVITVRAIRRLLLVAAIGLPLAAVVLGLITHQGAASWRWILYVAPLFAAGPLWIRERVRERGVRPDVVWAIDLTVFGLATARFLTGRFLPFSGHMLFLTYSGLSTNSRLYQVFAVVLILETAWFKFMLWDDPTSFWLGGLGALTAVVIRGVASRATAT